MSRILITGASRGIGAALADTLSAQGHEVLRTSRSAPETLALDVTDKGQSLDAGYPPEMWDDAFRTNVTGVFLTIQALLPALRRSGAGKIAIISSQMGSSERAPGGSYIYRATKSAVTNLGRNLAADLKGDGIAVGIYHPGWVRTDMGGSSADISVAESAAGLAARIDALSLDTTGAFETWRRRQGGRAPGACRPVPL